MESMPEKIGHQIGDGAKRPAAENHETSAPVENLRNLAGKSHQFVGLHEKSFFKYRGMLTQ